MTPNDGGRPPAQDRAGRGLLGRSWRVVKPLLQRSRAELGLLVPALLAALAFWAFAELADEVLEGETRDLDRAIVMALRTPDDLADPIGPLWVEEMGRDFTALGGIAVLLLLNLSVVTALWVQRLHRVALYVLITTLGGMAASLLLKHAFDRPRPDLVPQLSHVYTSSFPSGHSMMSATTYLTLAALLSRVVERRRLRVMLMGLAIGVAGLVGVSRVYLGVHWPTDVAAGWAAGAGWALGCWLVLEFLRRRSRIGEEVAES